MKKSLLFSVVSLLVFISCSSDDDNFESKLTGKWECKSASYTTIDAKTGEEVLDYYIPHIEQGSTLSFKNDGSVIYEIIHRGSFINDTTLTKTTHYILSSNTIRFCIEYLLCTYTIDEITSNRLSLYRDTVYNNSIRTINKALFEKID